MNQLPRSSVVPVPALAALFRDTTNSYKFLFFQALLALTLNQDSSRAARVLELDDLAIEMLAIAWYPHRFFHLSFGLQDQIARVLDRLDFAPAGGAIGFPETQQLLRSAIQVQTRSIGLSQLLQFVPYRLLSVFFEEELRGLPDGQKNRTIRELSGRLFDERVPLYRFEEEAGSPAIQLHPAWGDYLSRNRAIVYGWTQWEWLGYLQRRNPSIPALANKLRPPLARSALDKQTAYWKSVMEKEMVRCIYTGRELNGGPFALDHFVPWSFVCHDQLWNLIPVAPEANMSKGNALPDRSYLEPMIELQHRGLTVTYASLQRQHKRWERITESFLSDLHLDLDGLLDGGRLHQAYIDTVPPLLSLAERSGFSGRWRYKSS